MEDECDLVVDTTPRTPPGCRWQDVHVGVGRFVRVTARPRDTATAVEILAELLLREDLAGLRLVGLLVWRGWCAVRLEDTPEGEEAARALAADTLLDVWVGRRLVGGQGYVPICPRASSLDRRGRARPELRGPVASD